MFCCILSTFRALDAYRSERGSVALLTAGIFVILLAFTALTVDVGALYLTRRQLQSATDAAALAAALDLSRATSIAGSSLSSNSFGPGQLVAATVGVYQEDLTIAPAQRFTATDVAPNAVQVQTTTQAPLYFMRSLLSQSNATISATATAVDVNQAAFTAGTGLVSLNGGLANAILGQMLGTTVSLSAVQYNGLLNTNINLFDFLNAMATQLNLSAGTYSQVLASNVTMSSVLAAEAAALNSEGASGGGLDALSGLETLQGEVSGGQSFVLGNLVNLGFGQQQQVGSVSSSSAASASVNLYQLASMGAQLANGANAIAINGALNIPGVATADLYMTTIEPAQPPGPYITYGPVGMSVHTAQVRLLLTIHLVTALSYLGNSGVLTLPVYLELAGGNATLAAISCGSQPATDATVTISAQPSAASVYVAQVNKALITNFTTPVSLNTPATLVTLAGLLSITGHAAIVAGSPSATNLTFTQQQMQATPPASQTVTSTDMSTSVIDSIGSSLTLSVNVLGLPLLPGVSQLLTSQLMTLLAPVATQLDSLVDPVLAALGLNIGYINVTAMGVRCGVPSLGS